MGGDEQHRRADDGHDGDEVSKIQIGAVIRVEIFRDEQRRENLHEFGRLKLKCSHVNPRAHVARESSPNQHVGQQNQSEAVQKRGDLHQRVIVDGDEDDHQHDADERPDDLLAKQRRVGTEVRGAVHQHATDRRDEDGRRQ